LPQRCDGSLIVALSFFIATLSAWRAVYADPLPASVEGIAGAAVVKLSIKAIEGARTADSLGMEREGTGVLIGPRGLILTIGYLIVEAASILVVTGDGRIYPGTVVGFDHATGFGLVRAPGLVDGAVELGDSAAVRELHMVSVLAHAAAGGESRAVVVARRRFVGWWEYMIDNAIFTAPPRAQHSGAAMFDAAGRLLGIASLWVGDVLDVGAAFPGNMFVPIDLLKPILDDLLATGRRRAATRPWLGVYTEEHEGHVLVSRVLPESPAQRSGLKRGDVIIGVDGQSVGGQADFYEKVWARGDAGIAITLHALQNRMVRKVRVDTVDRLEYFKPWTY
jgi:serine protease Do